MIPKILAFLFLYSDFLFPRIRASQVSFKAVLIAVYITEVNISSYPVTRVTGLFLLSCAEIFKLGCFVQKYSDLGVSCRNNGQVSLRVINIQSCAARKVTLMVL